jgi:hypothetical protein
MVNQRLSVYPLALFRKSKKSTVLVLQIFSSPLSFTQNSTQTAKYANHPAQEGNCPVLLLRQTNVNIL